MNVSHRLWWSRWWTDQFYLSIFIQNLPLNWQIRTASWSQRSWRWPSQRWEHLWTWLLPWMFGRLHFGCGIFLPVRSCQCILTHVLKANRLLNKKGNRNLIIIECFDHMGLLGVDILVEFGQQYLKPEEFLPSRFSFFCVSLIQIIEFSHRMRNWEEMDNSGKQMRNNDLSCYFKRGLSLYLSLLVYFEVWTGKILTGGLCPLPHPPPWTPYF